ncbi:DNA alkylation repair protein [Paenibacillus mesophilus]|uniref:DNA alkylation repair protein n=1 Tax=Paenibacillus mesophilus TaxID=2582849 RepID=UPI00110DF020|nr:DNA alkylation repair protein [Paenibacillus mesophilus]TMV50725.1 DNA alkylation repair protein [Paenibacillus mesophilus]
MNEWISDLQARFAAVTDRKEATVMKAYMRGQFEFAGIKSPLRTAIVREWLSGRGDVPAALLEETVRGLWELPEREYTYAALDLLAKQAKRLNERHLELLETLVVTNSWWDTVDALAASLIGPLLLRHPQLAPVHAEKWIASDNIWLQRTALLFQLKYKRSTDPDRLFDYIRRTADSREFFIRKAIGWALREYSKTDAEAVIRFVELAPLSPLSRREALKWLDRQSPGHSRGKERTT